MNDTISSEIKVMNSYEIYSKIENIIVYYIGPLFNIIGLITNSLCILIFMIIIKKNTQIFQRHFSSSKMYHYLLMKSICDEVINFISMMVFIAGVIDKRAIKYSTNFIVLYFQYYLKYCSLLASILFDIAATLDCALSIENKFESLQKKTIFILISIVVILISLSFECFTLVLYKIYKYKVNDRDGIKYYYYYYSDLKDYSKSDIYNNLLFADSILRYFILLIILLSINVYILFKLIKINERKSNITNSVQTTQSIANRAKFQKMKMIISLFVINFFSNFLLLIYYTLSPALKNNMLLLSYIYIWGDLFSNIPISFSIFVYILFNNVFRKKLFRNIFLFISKCRNIC
jgi:hypothetical protein